MEEIKVINIIIQIAIAIVISAGGISGIILAIIKFSSNIIADRLSKTYELKLNKELEKYKTRLDSKIYITKARFDKEFELYQQLSRSFFCMIEKFHALYPIVGKSYEDNSLQIHTNRLNFNEAQVATVKAQEAIYSYAAFITKEFYEKYYKILQECRGLIGLYNPEKQPKAESFQKMEVIVKMFEDLNTELREYLSKLEVIE